MWSLTVHFARNVICQDDGLDLYYLFQGRHARGFVHKELMLVSEGTELPPDKIDTD